MIDVPDLFSHINDSRILSVPSHRVRLVDLDIQVCSSFCHLMSVFISTFEKGLLLECY
jgi:hypothetical protein